ncbi:MAG: tetratricopeptide repeat protein, partial [Calditrichae bacterium]|nr:tetratricopeptide repeat protein [candidate division Zixibacteria bacterium]NIW77985.1 tetratricopeptide repeat protein [Calditrichia bacterium]
MSDINRVMKQALAFHRDGKLGQAEKIYRGVLARHPDHPDALHLLGTIAIETNNFSDAVMLIGK